MVSLRLDARPDTGDGFYCLVTTISGVDAPERMGQESLLSVYDEAGEFAGKPSMSFFGTAEACMAEGSDVIEVIRAIQDRFDSDGVKARLQGILVVRGWRSMTQEDVKRSEEALHGTRTGLREAAQVDGAFQERYRELLKGWDGWHTGGGCMALVRHVRQDTKDGHYCLVTDDEGGEIPSGPDAPSLLGVYDDDGKVVFEPEKFFHGSAMACLLEGVAVTQAIRELEASHPGVAGEEVAAHLMRFLPERGWREPDIVPRTLDVAFRDPIFGLIGIADDGKGPRFWSLSPAGEVLQEVTDRLNPSDRAVQAAIWTRMRGGQ
jgi:hypothetical protein